MARIQKVEVIAETGSVSDAGTDADVYLGICGREFKLDNRDHDDLEAASSDHFLLVPAASSKLSAADRNDPTIPALDDGDLRNFPTYIRLEGNDHWQLKGLSVRVNPTAINPPTYILPFVPDLLGGQLQVPLWLGPSSGRTVFLRRIQ